jgi:hypothetical protein
MFMSGPEEITCTLFWIWQALLELHILAVDGSPPQSQVDVKLGSDMAK